MLLALRDGLRSGDVFVPGSRRYSDPAAYLLTPAKWADHRAEFCQLVGKPVDPARAWPPTSSTRPSTVWNRSSPQATARSAWTPTAIW